MSDERLIESINRMSSALNNIAGALIPKPKNELSSEIQDEALPNPIQAELKAVRNELYGTHQQLEKMTGLVEHLTKQLVELSKCALGGEPNISSEEMEKWTKLVDEFEVRAHKAEARVKELEEQCAKWHEKARVAEAHSLI